MFQVHTLHSCNMGTSGLPDIPFTAKLSSGKTFTFFQSIAKVFPLNHLLCTVHDGHGLIHREVFPVNNVFCTQLRKFSPSKVLPYMVYTESTRAAGPRVKGVYFRQTTSAHGTTIMYRLFIGQKPT